MTGVLLILSCFVLAVPAVYGASNIMCRTCHNVKDPYTNCTVLHSCHGHEVCVTDVHFLHGEYVFTKGCKDLDREECGDHPALIGKRQGPHHSHEHGQRVCRKCCSTSGCGRNDCSTYITPTTTATTIIDNGCRNYESPTFQCSEFSKYNFCTDTSSVGYAIAHDKCARHCGFCSPYGTVKPVTGAPTTMDPMTARPASTVDPMTGGSASTMAPMTARPASTMDSMTDGPASTMQPMTDGPMSTMQPMTDGPASTMQPMTARPASTTIMHLPGSFSPTTVGGNSPVSVDVDMTSTIDPDVCADKNQDDKLTCADMLRFGFCSPDSGSGYTLSKQICRKTCNIC